MHDSRNYIVDSEANEKKDVKQFISKDINGIDQHKTTNIRGECATHLDEFNESDE
mgnify:CR=1 FL=1